MIVIRPITESTRFALGVNVILKSDFSMKVKGNTKRRIQMKKELAQGKKKHYIFTEFTGRYKGTHK